MYIGEHMLLRRVFILKPTVRWTIFSLPPMADVSQIATLVFGSALIWFSHGNQFR